MVRVADRYVVCVVHTSAGSGMSDLKAGFCEVWRLIYPDYSGGESYQWGTQIGRIFGAISVVGMWTMIGRGFVWMFS
jgi:hypothetical protein